MRSATSSQEALRLGFELDLIPTPNLEDSTEETSLESREPCLDQATTDLQHTMSSATSARKPSYQESKLGTIEFPACDPSKQAASVPCRTVSPNHERRRVPVQKRRFRAYFRALILLFPVGVSCGILQLIFSNRYWRDIQRSGNSEALGILQIAAKAHEILIVYSLSKVVLHYVRILLGSSSGVPFGLFASAYGHTLGKPALAFGFWPSLVSTFWRWYTQWKSFLLAILILFSTTMGFAAGPASAIALIPQLKWWYTAELFYFGKNSSTACSNDTYDNLRSGDAFSLYVPKALFPDEEDSIGWP